jgi:hypothetical protein
MEAGGCGRSWAFHGFRATRLPELPLALPEEVPHGGLLFPGAVRSFSAVRPFIPRRNCSCGGSVAWSMWGPPTRAESGDGVKCGELKRGATGWVETARATRDVGRRPPAASATSRCCPALPCVCVVVGGGWLWPRAAECARSFCVAWTPAPTCRMVLLAGEWAPTPLKEGPLGYAVCTGPLDVGIQLRRPADG